MSPMVNLDPLFRDFMEVLDRWNPNKDRDPRNYQHCLGLMLARQGLAYQDQPQDIFETLALWSNEYFQDILLPGDVRKLVESLGQRRAAEFFYVLNQEFLRRAESARFNFVGARLVSPEERTERKTLWLAKTREARQAVMQQLYELAAQDDDTPWEWLMELVDFTRLGR